MPINILCLGDIVGKPGRLAVAELLPKVIKERNVDLVVANALWGQKGYPFLPPFQDMVKANYGAGLNDVDFLQATEEARKTINQWVQQQTKDKIKDLVLQDER